MDSAQLINNTVSFVKKQLLNAEGGHDWWHIERVWSLSKTIAASENTEPLVVELGALLHDISDPKFNGGDEMKGSEIAREFLIGQNVDLQIINHVIAIIENVSFKGGNEPVTFHSKELDVVQDADRLDAMGAIGIARTFNYGGYKNREMYNPAIPPKQDMTKEEYRNSKTPTINHFYEKLLLLKDRMNTTKGRKLAEERHQFMESFLEKFYSEWEGRK